VFYTGFILAPPPPPRKARKSTWFVVSISVGPKAINRRSKSETGNAGRRRNAPSILDKVETSVPCRLGAALEPIKQITKREGGRSKNRKRVGGCYRNEAVIAETEKDYYRWTKKALQAESCKTWIERCALYPYYKRTVTLCRLRTCQWCQAGVAGKRRDMLAAMMDVLYGGGKDAYRRVRHVVLTQRAIPDEDLSVSVKRSKRAWRLFLKNREIRAWVDQHIPQGAWSLETKWNKERGHWHTHLHLLAESKLQTGNTSGVEECPEGVQELSHYWNQCCRMAAESEGIEDDGLPWGVQVSVTAMKSREDLSEVAKYVAKGYEIPDDKIIETDIALFNVQTFNVWGKEWRAARSVVKAEGYGEELEENDDDETVHQVLDNEENNVEDCLQGFSIDDNEAEREILLMLGAIPTKAPTSFFRAAWEDVVLLAETGDAWAIWVVQHGRVQQLLKRRARLKRGAVCQ